MPSQQPPAVVPDDAVVLLDTVHGSHLYGLAHPGSDRDRYLVVDRRPRGHRKSRWAKQSIVGDADVMVTDLTSFLSMCDSGVPQALEAMFAPSPDVDRVSALRAGYRAGVVTSSVTYLRTITSFALAGDPKRRRHALRLAVNLSELTASGRFDPVLPVRLVQDLTTESANVEATMDALSVRCPYEIVWPDPEEESAP